MPHIVPEIKDYVSVEDYAYVRKLSKIGKSCLLVEETALKNVVDQLELLVPDHRVLCGSFNFVPKNASL